MGLFPKIVIAMSIVAFIVLLSIFGIKETHVIGNRSSGAASSLVILVFWSIFIGMGGTFGLSKIFPAILSESDSED